MKYCTKCLTTKPFSEFGKKKETKDGYRYCCRQCAAKMETDKRRSDADVRLRANENAKKYRDRKKTSPESDVFRAKNIEMCKKYYYKNHDAMKDYSKKWREKNREHKRFMNTMRKKYIKRQTPGWANKNAIRDIYLSCPEGFHVDHIIPIRGKIVSGLHVESNLRHLEGLENISKNNSFDQELFTIIF